MFSVDNFYQYLMHSYSWPRKNNFLYQFRVHGSRNLFDVFNIHPETNEFYKIREQGLERFFGGLFLLDQEPLLFEQLYTDGGENHQPHHDAFPANEALESRMSNVHMSILCHSERNSEEIKYFTDRGYLEAHYWYHGLIARDWFRHWKHYIPNNFNKARFGCYIRDMTGTRAYRKQLFEFIKTESSIFCPLKNNIIVDSNASAILSWEDTGKFDIQLVPETLFDTQKTHLTEKALKPIAMEQPFILFAGPNSLQYMRDYGFQTFSCCWDESYDTITNSEERYNAIIDLIQHINSLPSKKYHKILRNAKLIAKNNREHFYSQRFEDILLSELHTNINKALEEQQELFYTRPGGTYFDAVKKLKNFRGASPDRYQRNAKQIIKYMLDHYPSVAEQILKQYPDLF